jgi:hypothetical protein
MSDGGFTRRCLLLPHIIFDLDDPNDTKTENISFSQASLDTVGAVAPRREVHGSNSGLKSRPCAENIFYY